MSLPATAGLPPSVSSSPTRRGTCNILVPVATTVRSSGPVPAPVPPRCAGSLPGVVPEAPIPVPTVVPSALLFRDGRQSPSTTLVAGCSYLLGLSFLVFPVHVSLRALVEL